MPLLLFSVAFIPTYAVNDIDNNDGQGQEEEDRVTV